MMDDFDTADVAPLQVTVICAGLRDYGRSGCPLSTPDHAPYATVQTTRGIL
jgi:haloacetate dehalogenase